MLPGQQLCGPLHPVRAAQLPFAAPCSSSGDPLSNTCRLSLEFLVPSCLQEAWETLEIITWDVSQPQAAHHMTHKCTLAST